jgi:membrane protease YdiL (CAAX protease family)
MSGRFAVTTIVREPFRYYVLLLVTWTGAWLLYESTNLRNLSEGGAVAYWTAAKMILWIAPILLNVAFVMKRPVADYLRLTEPGRGMRIGLAIGAVLVALLASVDIFVKTFGWPSPAWGLLTALVIAPLFEELMFRGFVLRALQESGYGFWPANAVAALMFLGLHLPGWYFTNGLEAAQLLLGVIVVIVGLVAGYAKRRAQSTWASVAVHFLNNLYSVFVR